jgi:dipeptidyl aminopeptidase/acylaminoacyl peptidase
MRKIASMSLMAICLLLAPLLSSARAEATPGPLKMSDVFNYELANDPQISPDGKRIVYVRIFSDIMSDKNYANLWMINFDGSDNRPLTTGNHADNSPRWSKDGSRIIYISDAEGTPQIYMRWMDTGQTARLTNLQFAPAGISWSPDDKQISFTAFVPERGAQVAMMPAAPAGAKWADPPTVIDKLIYRYNGPGYLKAGFTHLFVIPAEGGTPRQISSGNFQHGGLAFNASEAVWTPDGKYLLMSANRKPNYELEPLDTEVYEFSVATGAARALTTRKGPDNSPAVSADGKLIAYTGFDDKYQGYQVTRLYVMNRDGSGARLLTAGLDRDVRNLRWADDSSGIYFLSDDQGNTKLKFISLGGRLREVTGNVGSSGTASPGGTFTIARNGALAFTYSTPRVPADIAVATTSDTAIRVITAVNEDLLAQRKIGEVETLWYTSSVDGRKVEGWIIKPPDFDSSKKYPLILEIHGGPFSNYGDRFDFEKQAYAARGYVVLYTNPRGSTSYGEEFGNLIHHKYPGDDFYDLNSGVDAVIAKGYIDPQNLFVTGGSGGGVLTAWMIGRTDRFRAAAAAYPVINWYSFVLTADIPVLVSKYWFPGLPWENAEHYEKRSLLSVVKNVKTPTMVITGEEDYRTPMSESEQYYQALKLLGVESVLVKVPGEPHGIRRRPSHWMAKMLNISAWFDQHKKSPAMAEASK